MMWPRVSTILCSQESSGRLSVRQPTGRGEGVSSWMTNAPKPGDRLQMSSGRSTQIYGSHPWKIPRDVILREVEGYRFGHILILLEGCARGIFHGGDPYIWVLLPEDICNRSPGFCALVIQEETPSPLPVGCLSDSLPELS